MNIQLCNGDKAPVIDAQGRKRGLKVWIVCSFCEQGRWVAERATRRKAFSGMCHHCQAKMTTGQFDKHSRWTGGYHKDTKGYQIIKLQLDDFFYPMAKKSGYIYEHRLVMAKHLGRCLLPWEIIHHKNSIRDDNRLENLELLPTGKYHIVDTHMKSLIHKLEVTIYKLQAEIASLKNKARKGCK